MTEGDPPDRLSAKHQFVLVLRAVVEVDEEIRGELVDPLSQQRRRFTGLESLVDGVRAWTDDARGVPATTRRQAGRRPVGS
jgi:hypothetical protein